MNVDVDEEVAKEDFPPNNSFLSSGEIPIVIPSDFIPDLNLTASVNHSATILVESELTTLHNNSTTEQVDSTVPSDDDDYSYNYSYNDHYELLCEGVLNDLKNHKNNSDYLFSKLYTYFGVQLTYDENLHKWLTRSIGTRKNDLCNDCSSGCSQKSRLRGVNHTCLQSLDKSFMIPGSTIPLYL